MKPKVVGRKLFGFFATATMLATSVKAPAQNQCSDACWSAHRDCLRQHGDQGDCQGNLNACIAGCNQPPACPDPHAVLGPPQSLTATTMPSNSEMGQVNLSWATVPGADGYKIYREQPSLKDYHNPYLSLGHVSGPALAVPLQPGAASNAAESDLPLFYPVDFLISTIKYVNGSNGSKVSCEGSFTRSNGVVPVGAPDAPVWGFADTHTHQFPNLAFNGYIIGQAFGDPAHAFDGDYVGHGIILGQPSHHTGGYPNFDGWPTSNILVHQQMYEDWLYRAFLGGLRLMVMHGVNNETMCVALSNAPAVEDAALVGGILGAGGGGAALGALIASMATSAGEQLAGSGGRCNDMDAVDREIQAAKDMEAYLNNQCAQADPPRCPQKGMGWYHIVTSAKDARETINRGQLAVVLGIEVDRLFDCALTTQGDRRTGGRQCDLDYVRTALGVYYDQGVRHIFPAHLANTAFAGMAIYGGPISWNFNNHFLNGQWLDAGSDACTDPSVTFDLNLDWSGFLTADAFSFVGGLGYQGSPPTYPGKGHCNHMGLTPLGKELISLMMSRHMIIDIDHMSEQSVKDTLAITSPLNYPVIAGHTGFLGVANSPESQNESAKTDAQLSYIRSSGGLVAAGLNAGTTQSVREYTPSWRKKIDNNCSNSSKTWAQEYLYAVDHMGGPASAAVAVATDQPLNAFPGPRFGPNGCSGGSDSERQSQLVSLVYDVGVLNPGLHVALSRSQTFNRTWDFNNDGMAHIGMYPDMIQDLLTVGLTEQDFQPLFRSAEGYIKMWERAEQISSTGGPRTDRLNGNQQLNVNDRLFSPNGKFTLVMQGDGNLVLYTTDTGKVVWSSNTWNTPTLVTHAIMQNDGNFVCYDANGKEYWSSKTWNHAGAFVVLQDDGNLVVRDGGSGVNLWTSPSL